MVFSMIPSIRTKYMYIWRRRWFYFKRQLNLRKELSIHKNPWYNLCSINQNRKWCHNPITTDLSSYMKQNNKTVLIGTTSNGSSPSCPSSFLSTLPRTFFDRRNPSLALSSFHNAKFNSPFYLPPFSSSPPHLPVLSRHYAPWLLPPPFPPVWKAR